METEKSLSSYHFNIPEDAGILVTGGGGFVGRKIVNILCRKRLRVVTFSRSLYPYLDDLGVKQVQGDLADLEAICEALQGCSLVFHVAAKAGIWGTYRDFYRSNVFGTENVIEGCFKQGIDRLVYTSSPSVVFNGKDMEGVDESTPYAVRFNASYPATKAMAERRVLEANSSKLATVAIRPHLIWGPGDTHIIPGLLKRASRGQLRRLGRREKKVDFTYIDNAVHAHLLAAERLFPGSPISGRSFFVTDDSPIPIWMFINKILNVAGLPLVKKTVSPGLAYLVATMVEVVHWLLQLKSEPRLTRFLVEEMSTAHWFDVNAAKECLGYQPVVDLETGMKRVAVWLSKTIDSPCSKGLM